MIYIEYNELISNIKSEDQYTVICDQHFNLNTLKPESDGSNEKLSYIIIPLSTKLAISLNGHKHLFATTVENIDLFN